MAATAATRAIGRSRQLFFNRPFSSSFIFRIRPLPGFTKPVPSTVSLSHSLRFAPGAVRLNLIRCVVNRSGGAPPEIKKRFFGIDYQHWLILMYKPGGEGATKQQMIDCYVETLARVVGSEEEAKKKIYNILCEGRYGFACELDEETSYRLEGIPGVQSVCPDSWVDDGNKVYGSMNGALRVGVDFFWNK